MCLVVANMSENNHPVTAYQVNTHARHNTPGDLQLRQSPEICCSMCECPWDERSSFHFSVQLLWTRYSSNSGQIPKTHWGEYGHGLLCFGCPHDNVAPEETVFLYVEVHGLVSKHRIFHRRPTFESSVKPCIFYPWPLNNINHVFCDGSIIRTALSSQ